MAYFIKDINGDYQLTNETIGGLSINDIAEHLGYNAVQIYTIHAYEDKTEISTIVLKVFTKDVLFVLSENDEIEVNEDLIQNYIERNSFDPLYNSLEIEEILLEAVEHKSFNYKFISDVFGVVIDDVDGEFFVPKHDLYLMFVNGILTSFRFSNELNKWAKHLKELNFDVFKGYSHEAKYYRGEDFNGIIFEVNSQADGFSKAPNGFTNEFVDNHITEFGNIDFVELLICNYQAKISENDFRELYMGRFRHVKNENGNHVYKKRNLYFYFDENGHLILVNKE